MGLKKLTIDELIRNSAEKYRDHLAITWKDPQQGNVEINEMEQKINTYKDKIKENGGNNHKGGLEKKIKRLSEKVEKLKWQGLTYKAFFEHIESFAKGLRIMGLGKGDRVAILGDNSPQWLIASFGIQYVGGISVPLPPQILAKKPKALVESERPLLEHNQPKAIVIDQEYYDMLTGEDPDFFKNIPSIEKIILIKDKPMLVRPLDKLDEEDLVAKVGSKAVSYDINEILRGGKLDKTPLKPDNNEDDIASIVYTSGTTGSSVGVMHTHKAIFSNLLFAKATFPIDERSRLLSTAPFAHVLGLLLCGYAIFHVGGRYILYSSLKSIAHDVKYSKTTHLVSFPQLYTMMFDRIYNEIDKNTLAKLLMKLPIPNLKKVVGKMAMSKAGLARVQFFLSGGAKLSEETWRRAARLGVYILEGYGLTEAPVDSVMVKEIRQYGGAVGIPLVGIEPDKEGFERGVDLKGYEFLKERIRVRMLPAEILSGQGVGYVEEVLFRGPNMMQGYFKDEEKTARVFYRDPHTGEEWLRTGDIGKISRWVWVKGRERPLLALYGRLKSIIVLPNGKNVDPEEIEARVKTHTPLIGECRLREITPNSGDMELLVQPNYSEDVIKGLYQKFGESLVEGQAPKSKELASSLEEVLKEQVKLAIPYMPPHISFDRVTYTPLVDVTWTRKVKRGK